MLLACTTMASAATPAQLQELDATVERVRAQFDVPGIAVAVVKDGEVVLERGWGVREQGKPEPVQADTLFAIASNTKAFTATSLNLLAEDGKLKMDDKVIDHLPSFRMSDPFVTGQMTIRDLLSHRSGLSLGAGDLLFWPTTSYSNAEVVERLGKVPLKGGFREGYAYDNILYAVAQQVIEHVSGMSYQQFLQTRIFDKVGMAGTRYNADHLKPGDKAAVGHAKYDFKDLRTVAPLTWSNNAGAGGIYSSAHDMARWMQVQLAEGKLADGTPLFSEKSQQQMWRMITPQSIPAPSVPELAPARANFAGYGEGWSLSDYRGQKLVWHTGGWPGMVSRLTLVPGEKLGVVVLTNQEVGAAFNAITLSVLDAYLGGEKHDWVDAYAKAVAKGQDKADEAWAKHQSARDKGSRPSLAGRLHRHVPRPLVWRHAGQCRGQGTAPALCQDRAAERTPGALAARHLHRALGRPFAQRRRVRELQPGPGRQGARGAHAADFRPDRFQFRFPGPAVHPSEMTPPGVARR